jgi:hypothetical protein
MERLSKRGREVSAQNKKPAGNFRRVQTPQKEEVRLHGFRQLDRLHLFDGARSVATNFIQMVTLAEHSIEFVD